MCGRGSRLTRRRTRAHTHMCYLHSAPDNINPAILLLQTCVSHGESIVIGIQNPADNTAGNGWELV